MARKHEDVTENGSKPVFDYTTYSRKEQKIAIREQTVLQRLAAKLADPAAYDDDEFEEKFDEFERLQDEFEAKVCQRIVSVPVEWLVPGAPADLDWSKPGAFDWLRADKIDELTDAATEARHPEQVTKNSAKR